MTINAPGSLLLLLYELVAEEQGVAAGAAVRHDPERHPQGVHRPRQLHLPGPAQHAADRRHVPLLHRAAAALEHDLDLGLPHPGGRLDGRPGAGLHARQRHRLRRRRRSDAGLEVDAFARRLSFFFNAHNDFFQEVAKFRAARMLWAELMRDRFGAGDERSLMLRFHAQTGGSTLTAQQPENNIVRVAIQAFAAVCGGGQSLHTNGFDEALALPTERSATIALRTQQILATEAGWHDHRRSAGRQLLHRGADRRAGRPGARADRRDRPDGRRRGGRRAGLGAGPDRAGRLRAPPPRAVGRGGDRRRQPLHRGQRRADRAAHDRPRGGAAAGRAHPGAARRAATPRRSSRRWPPWPSAAGGEDNLLPPMREALRAEATIGEVCEVLRGAWGTYDAQRARA